MHIETRGQGPDLVLLHGWSMHSGVWHKLAERLSANFTLHLVDLPGHGRSQWHDGALELDQITQQLADRLPETAYWMGWSLGGLISLNFASHYPQRVKKLILMASTPKFVQAQDWPCAVQKTIFEQFAANLETDQQQTLQRFLLLQVWGTEQGGEIIKELSQQLALMASPHKAALRAGLDLLLNVDMRQALAALPCPLQAILGQRDPLIPETLIEHLQLLRPEISVTNLLDAGHAPFISQPAACQQAIEQFINE